MPQFKSMFREYDIRGRVNQDELNEGSLAVIARAFAAFLQKRGVYEVVVGYDNRRYSPAFAKVAVETLVRYQMKVYDIGLSLSPVAYFAQHYLKARGVMMITASHNPDGWSGLKLGCDYSSTLGSAEVAELYALTKENIGQEGLGEHVEINVRGAYLENILERVSVDKEYAPKIVVDAGNGGAGLFAYELFQRMGCPVFQLNCDPDTDYPHYFPNPSDLSALTRLREMVTHPYVQADLGIAFDGDGDRIGVMDAQGESIWSDRILMLLAAALLEKEKGAKIVFDVKCTQALIDVIEQCEGQPIMWKTGHSHIKAKMQEIHAALAGERSGHIFFGGNTYWGFDDALFAAAKLVEFIAQKRKPLATILQSYPQYCTSPEIKVPCADEHKYRVVEQITQNFKQKYGEAVLDINGARVRYPDGWGLVRASSNLPELVLVFEGTTSEIMLGILAEFQEELSKYAELSSHWENMPSSL